VLTCRTPVFQFQIVKKVPGELILQVITPRKSPQTPPGLFPNERNREPSRWKTLPLAESGCG